MADNKPTLTSAKSASDWVSAFYGDDAFDYKKVEKLRHIKHTGQFAAICYAISKNTKQAHTDFFEDNYTTVDKKYAQAAELILKLLYVKFNEERELTRADFDACGGLELFGGSKNYDQIVSDYIGSGGMVEMGQTLIPISTDNAKTAKNIKEINDDMDNVKKDHTRLLAITGSTDGTLSREQIFNLFTSASDNCSNAWKMHKKAKTTGELALQKDLEEAYMLRYDLAKKSGKVAILAGTTIASIGAVVGGVFWPALLLLPVHSLSKKWLPDWFKSMGAMWGSFEKRFKDKRAIDRAAAFQKYIVSYAETGGKPKLSLKERFLVRPADMTLLKKQAKQVKEGLTLEGTDGKVHKSAMDEALDAISGSSRFGQLLNNQDGDGLVPADAADVLNTRLKRVPSVKGDDPAETARLRETALKHLDPDQEIPTFKDFMDLARTYKGWKSKLSTDAQRSFEYAYSDKLLDSAELLIFATPMESLTDYKDKVAKYFAEDSIILEPVKETRPDVLEDIKRYVTFASKELTGLDKSWNGKTLYEYIHRNLEPKISDTELNSGYVGNPATSPLKEAIETIKNLGVSRKDYRKVESTYVSGTSTVSVDLAGIQNLIGNVTDAGDKARLNKLLQDQMTIVFRNDTRNDSKVSYQAVVTGEFTGKNEFSDVFEKLKTMDYSNVGSATYSTLRTELMTNTKITPPEMGRYLCGKISKQAYDVFSFYAGEDDNKSKFTTDLPFLIEYLKKLNNSSLLNEQQKAALTINVKSYVAGAVDKYARDLAEHFMDAEDSGGYSQRAISKFLNDTYADGGLKLLFETDKSTEIAEVKKKFSSLNTLDAVHTNLKFNGYEMSAADKKIMGIILIRDGNKNFSEMKVRGGNDKLIDFLSNSLKCSTRYDDLKSATLAQAKDSSGNPILDSRGNPITDIQYRIQKANTPYAEIVAKLDRITTGNLSTLDFFDKHGALIALKNRTIIEFRKSLTKMIQDKRNGVNANEWLLTVEGRNFYDEVKNAWAGLFSAIDMATYNNYQAAEASAPDVDRFKDTVAILGSTGTMADEMARYDSTYTIGLSEEKSLGG
ncbi:MAG: hypothetical protein IKJ33_05895 [Clostridia bacterium]|nr:hypothetical protein [Clostridia bacterium]